MHSGGCELALAANFQVYSSRARLGFPEVRLGVMPDACGTQRPPCLIGAARAKRMIMTGRAVRPEEALAWGLVDVVTEPGVVHHTAIDLVRPFLNGPATALGAVKHAIDAGLVAALPTGRQLERSLFNGLSPPRANAQGCSRSSTTDPERRPSAAAEIPPAGSGPPSGCGLGGALSSTATSTGNEPSRHTSSRRRHTRPVQIALPRCHDGATSRWQGPVGRTRR